MIILGIDQSLTETGVTILSQKEILYKGLVKSKRKGIKRLLDIKNQLMDINREYKPDYVVMEGYGFMTKGRAFELGELGGVIKVMFTEIGKEPIIIHPSHLKKYITGKGNADKSVMLVNIYKKYNIEFDNHNIADSFGLGKMGQSILMAKNGEKTRKDFNKEEWNIIKEYIN